MNHKHSFPTRCLALLLALVLILSNANLGLTMRLQAADNTVNTSLFELIAEYSGNEEMSDVLDYAGALVDVQNEDVVYVEVPVAELTLRKGVLKAAAFEGWVPYSYTAGNTTGYFNGETEVEVGDDVHEASVVYQLDLNQGAAMEKVMEQIKALATEMAEQKEALSSVSSLKPLTALNILNRSFINEMIDAVDSLKAEDFGEDVDLDEVKAEYKAIIAQMLNRMVTEDSPYYNVVDEDGYRPYKNRLVVYAMLNEYANNTGIAHFYQNDKVILNELSELAAVLYDILGEYDNTTGKYANDSVIKALLVEMEAENDVTVQNLADMAQRMEDAVAALDKADALYKTALNLESDDLAGLCKALNKLVKMLDSQTPEEVFGYNTQILLESAAFTVQDDSYKFINITLKGTGIQVSCELDTDTVMTDDVVKSILDKIAANAPHYALVDAAALEAELKAIGTLSETVNLTVEVKANVYELPVWIEKVDGEKLTTLQVSASDVSIQLPVDENYVAVYNVNGTEYNSKKGQPVTVTISDKDMNLIAAGEFNVVRVSNTNYYEEDRNNLVESMNNGMSDGASVELETNEDGEEVLNANLNDLSDLTGMAGALADNEFDGEFAPIELGGKLFVTQNNTTGQPQYNTQALVDAFMGDSTFSSQKLIDLAYGRTNNLLNTTMGVPGYDDMPMSVNMNNVPEALVTVGKGLDAVKNFMTFKGGQMTPMARSAETISYLDIQLNLPEKVYEAYLTAALATWELGEADIATVNNRIAMEFVKDYFDLLMSSDMDIDTITNTLAGVGVNINTKDYNAYYKMLKKVVNSKDDQGNKFSYEIDPEDDNGFMTVKLERVTKNDVMNVLNLLGFGGTISQVADMYLANEELNVTAIVTLENSHPKFDAVVVEPGKINDTGIKAKMNTVDYTTNLSAKKFDSHVAVMLLADVQGDLNFPKSAILDLNGHTVMGDITANGKLVIIDSELDTYNGGYVIGDITSNGGAILGGRYTDENVVNYLRDGYTWDEATGAVRNPVFYIEQENGVTTYNLNVDFYQLCEGYLPSVEALAAEIATDVVLNGYYAYTAAALSYKSENGFVSLYDINFDEIFNSYLGGGKDGAVDALVDDLINTINVKGIETMANEIIADLCDFKALAEALNNNEAVASYTFAVNPLTVDLHHDEEQNILDLSVISNQNITKTATVALKIEGENDYYEYAKKLLTAMADIVTVEAGIELLEPTYDSVKNDLTVGGGASADVVIDLSSDCDYTKAIAIILAYGNPDKAEELMAHKDCVMDLNTVIASMTVEEVFTALKNMSRDVSMLEMAEAVGYVNDDNIYENAEEVAKLEAVYHVILCGLGKALECLDVTGNNNTLATYLVEDATYAYGKTVSDKTVDASVKSYTGIVKLTVAEMNITIKLAPKCTQILGDADRDGEVTTLDAALIRQYYVGRDVQPHLCVSDVDGDGEYTTLDSAYIRQYYVGKITTFPVEDAE